MLLPNLACILPTSGTSVQFIVIQEKVKYLVSRARTLSSHWFQNSECWLRKNEFRNVRSEFRSGFLVSNNEDVGSYDLELRIYV